MAVENNWMARLLLGEREATSWTIYASSVENAEVLKLATRDDAECRGVGASSSNVIEDLIIAAELPSEERARGYAVTMYLHDAAGEPKSKISDSYEGGSGIVRALSALCADLAAGTNWKSAYPATEPLLDYIDDYICRHSPTINIVASQKEAGYVADRFSTVAELVDSASAELLGDCGGSWYAHDAAAIAREISLGNYAACNPVSYLRQFSPIVGDSTHAFRFLVALLDNLEPIRDTATERRRFVEAVTAFCEEWADYDRIMAERKSKPAPTGFTMYDLAGSDRVEIPDRYTVVNPLDASRSRYVLTISLNSLYAGDYGEIVHAATGLRSYFPSFAYFSEKPLEELDETDRMAIERNIAIVYPPFSVVIEDEKVIGDLVWMFPAKENEGWSGSACIIHRGAEGEA